MSIGCNEEASKLLQRHEGGAEIGKALIAQDGLDPFHCGADRIKPQHHASAAPPVMQAIGFQKGAVVMGDTPVTGIKQQHFA
jgi:hypothetical protein